MDLLQNKISKTKNKFLKEINHYLNENSNNPEEKKENNAKYPRISMSQRYQKNTPVLPVIKNNIMGLEDKFNLHVLTEANNKSTRNKIKLYWNNSNRNDFVNIRNNIQKNISKIVYKDKYKSSEEELKGFIKECSEKFHEKEKNGEYMEIITGYAAIYAVSE